MKHFVFHIPVLVSVVEEDEDAGGAVVVKDHSRRHLDVHVHAEDLEAASASMEEKLGILLGEDEPPASGEHPSLPYIGPV